MPEWLSWTAAIASIVGLLVGVVGVLVARWAALNARGAKEAASAARRAMSHERAVDELLALRDSFNDLALLLRGADLPGARQSATETLMGLVAWESRFALAAGVEHDGDLVRCKNALGQLEERMHRLGDLSPTEEQMADFAERAHRCRDHLAKVLARSQATLESRHEEGI